MDDPVSNSALWKEIERSESYLVCCMFEEAASSAFSVLKQACKDKSTESTDIQLYELMESAGMVLVQSWKELGRAQTLLDELKALFGTVTAIPVTVLVAGVCLQLAEGASSGVQESLEAFLINWRYVDDRYCVLVDKEADLSYLEGCDGYLVLGVEKYLEVVDVYVTFLVKVLNDIGLAYSWVEKVALPEGTRQQLLRRLHSLKATDSSKGGISTLLADEHKNRSSLEESNISEGPPKILEEKYPPNGGKKQAILKICRRFDPIFWWFRTITLKFGSGPLVISNGKVVLGCMIFIVYYVVRRKQATLKRLARRQSMSIKKGLSDLWKLAFSYQVNPLAAVQPHPALNSGSRR